MLPSKLEFNFPTISALQDFVNALPEKKPTEEKAAETMQAEPVEKPKRTPRGPKPELPEGQQVPSFIGKKEAAPEPAAEPVEKAPKEEPIVYAYVQKATFDVIKATGGREVITDLLTKEFSVESAKVLPEKEWPRYLKRCGDILKSHQEESLA